MRALMTAHLLALQQRHAQFRDGLTSAIFTALHATQFTDPTARVVQLASDASDDMSTGIAQAVEAVVSDVVASQVRHDTNPARFRRDQPVVDAYLTERIATTQQTIAHQLQRDAATALAFYRRFRLEAVIGMDRGMSQESAMTQARERLLREQGYRDRIGRRWDAGRFVQVELKRALFETHNLMTVYMLSAAGETEAVLSDPGEPHDGRVFNLDQFPEIEQRYCHPGSNAIVSANELW